MFADTCSLAKTEPATKFASMKPIYVAHVGIRRSRHVVDVDKKSIRFCGYVRVSLRLREECSGMLPFGSSSQVVVDRCKIHLG
jgi:hypothetical protein